LFLFQKQAVAFIVELDLFFKDDSLGFLCYVEKILLNFPCHEHFQTLTRIELYDKLCFLESIKVEQPCPKF